MPEVFSALEESGLLKDLPVEISVTTSGSWQKKAKEYQISDFIFLDAVLFLESLAATDANLSEYRNLSWTISQQLMTSIHRIQVANNSAPFILKQLENLPENRVAVSTVLHDLLPGRTAIVLAGGPSLNAALPWIRENRDRLVVIAVSRISRILLDEGIVPHFVVSVDPQKISFDVSREMLRFAGLPNPFEATRYHSLVVERNTLPECLKVTAWVEEGEIMGLEHRELPVWGVQFHPESILTLQGMDILRNFLKITG